MAESSRREEARGGDRGHNLVIVVMVKASGREQDRNEDRAHSLKATVIIDMSAAFDTINRQELLDVLRNIVDEDDLRMIRFLLSNTAINMTVNGASEKHCFNANTGTPQGDGLSPVLFIIYLENALRDVRVNPEHKLLPPEVAYADDVDFISLTEYRDVNNIQNKLAPHQLNVNIDKTEYTAVERKPNKSEETWRKTKKGWFSDR